MRMQQVTKIEYTNFQKFYDEFNKKLFNDELSQCLITLQRRTNSSSYFSPEAFSGRGCQIKTDEISLNPDSFGLADEVVLSNLAHEMVHMWNYHNGSISKNTPRYHDQNWAKKMISIGLQPVSHDLPDSMVGQRVSHKIVIDSKFDKLVKSLLRKGLKINWKSKDFFADQPGIDPLEKERTPKKIKFVCLQCEQLALATKETKLVCGICFMDMVTDI